MSKWGDCWRFTDMSIGRAVAEVFGEENVVFATYGNVLSSVAFLHGFAAEELSGCELVYKDNDYQVIIGVKAVKRIKE